MSENQDNLKFDVIIIGAGPAGLATAIRMAQLAKQQQREYSICILEKGATVGSHILAGAVLEPRSLNELIPNWRELGAPLTTPATNDQFLFLTATNHFKLPTPPQMHNQGNYIISLSQLCRWLADQAEQLGIQIYPGFAATEIVCDANQQVIGVITGDNGVAKNGEHKANFQPGMHLLADYTVFAEGSRGSLTKKVIEKYQLQNSSDPQTYGLGIKEVWEVPAEQHKSGTVIHTVGWPLDSHTYGGGFLYHMDPNLIALGFVVGLDYSNTYLSPYDELQRFKQHPHIRQTIANSRCIEYGARVINEGGLQSIPQVFFPGGVLVGCAAGFLNVPKIKGIHTAIKSGMLAAETIHEALSQEQKPINLTTYGQALKSSWIWSELKTARNIRPAFQCGLWFGLAYAAFDTYILRGKAPWTFHNIADYKQLKPAIKCKPINYPTYDGVINFDKLTALRLANINQSADQPPHLKLSNPKTPITINLEMYAGPEQRYCPANVYEFVSNPHSAPYLQINAQNCVHCKACDVKDPTQNITWTPPEGGGGPNYTNM
jgi:electron-transferring-flavoprotein dehydrogenase